MSAERAQAFDLVGAASDLDELAKRHAPIHAWPGVSDLLRLCNRNPWAAPAALEALREELARQPERAVGLDQSLFPLRFGSPEGGAHADAR